MKVKQLSKKLQEVNSNTIAISGRNGEIHIIDRSNGINYFTIKDDFIQIKHTHDYMILDIFKVIIDFVEN